MELLLLSNSTLPGKARLEHALPLIANQLNGRRSAVFIPFAGVTQTWDEYTDKTAEVLAPLGINVTGFIVSPIRLRRLRKRKSLLSAAEIPFSY